jgi:hypothetical protein
MKIDDEEGSVPCPECQIYPVGRFNTSGNRTLGVLRERCIRCQMKKENLDKNKKYGKPKKSLEKKKCKMCENIYQPKSITHNYCSEICREKGKNKELNDKWMKKEYKPPHAMSLQTQERFTNEQCYYKNPEWTKKFKTVRG